MKVLKQGLILATFGVLVLGLQGCDTFYSDHYGYGYNADYDNYYRDNRSNRYNRYHRGNRYYGRGRRGGRVHVPQSYHFSNAPSPTKHKQRDKQWVNSQNPGAYTIQLGQGEKASDVAKQLSTAPKSERRAQVKYNQNGKTYYRGVYGSYPNRQAAEEALQQLPASVRDKAGVKSWNNVQQGG